MDKIFQKSLKALESYVKNNKEEVAKELEKLRKKSKLK